MIKTVTCTIYNSNINNSIDNNNNSCNNNNNSSKKLK